MTITQIPSYLTQPDKNDEVQLAGILSELIEQGARLLPKNTKLYHGSSSPLSKLSNDRPLFLGEKEVAKEYSTLHPGEGYISEFDLNEGRMFTLDDAIEMGMVDKNTHEMTPLGTTFAEESPAGSYDYNWQDMAYSDKFRRLLEKEDYRYILQPEGMFIDTTMEELISLFPKSDLKLR